MTDLDVRPPTATQPVDDETWGPDLLDRIAAERMRDELDDIAYYRKAGWPAGGS
jgi:hypothetical protein